MGLFFCWLMIRIVLPLAGSSLGLPGSALLLPVSWMERHDFRTKRTEDSVSLGNSSVMNFLISGLLSLIKNAHNEFAAYAQGRTRKNAGTEMNGGTSRRTRVFPFFRYVRGVSAGAEYPL
jgi:hypothetical protein